MALSDIARLLTLAGLWGASFVFIRIVVPALGPLWLAFLRVALAFVALFAVAGVQRSIPPLRERWRDYLVVGTINSALPFALFAFAEESVSASMAAILNATSPFFGALVAALWLKETLTGRQLAGMALGVGGVVWLVGWHGEPLTQPVVVAIFACLAAAFCYGISSVYAKVRLSGVASTSTALYSQLGATVVLAPALFTAPLPSAPGVLVAASMLALAVASTAYAYRLYFRLIANVGPTRALTVTFLIPLFGVLWSVLFLSEPLTMNMIFGGALILAGTWLATRARPRSAATQAEGRSVRRARRRDREPACAARGNAEASADRRRCT
jgi:drug/metabolite transporter (DMT)-like permease